MPHSHALALTSVECRYAVRCHREWLQALAQALPRQQRGDRLQDMSDKPLIPAAVLVPLVYHPSHLSVLLTQRTEHLGKHPGQIAFPGGRAEAEDASAEATALRESLEEIGLRAELVAACRAPANYITHHRL